MKPCNDYPISFAYKAQDGQYYGPNGSVGLYHRGEDRACPTGSPIIVQGVTIGLVGATGLASGPHLHFQCMRGGDVDPAPYRWAAGKVTTAGWHSQFGNHIRITHTDGTEMIYAHLSKINVTVGQVLGGSTGGGDMPIPDHDNYYGRYNKLMMQVRGREMSRDEFRKNIVGVSDLVAVERISDNPESDRATEWQNVGRLAVQDKWQQQIYDLTSRVNQLSGEVKGLAQTINEKQAEISSLQDKAADLEKENKELKAQLATCGGDDTELLNSFGEILRKIIARLGVKK